jgi:hypothetical protein
VLRTAGQLEEEKRDRRRRGVVPGKEQRHDLVAQLLIGQAGAILVFGVEQQAQDVRPPLAARQAARDLREDHRVEQRPCAVHRPPR